MNIVLIKPIISEKSTKMAKAGQFAFIVRRFARKPEIKKAVENQFSVKVVSVKTVNLSGQTKMQRTRRGWFETHDIKKAYVTLKKGQKINLFMPEEVKVEKAEDEIKEKKSLLKGTKVKIEKKGEKS